MWKFDDLEIAAKKVSHLAVTVVEPEFLFSIYI